MDDANSKFGIGHRNLRAQDIPWVEFDDSTVLFKIARLWLNRINEGGVNSPRSDAVAELNEGAPFAVRVTVEKEGLQLLPLGCRNSEEAALFVGEGMHGRASLVRAMNPAKDFVKVGVQSVLVLVPRRSAAAVMRMIAHQLPTPAVRHNEAL
jgi:hypothetical protein